MRACVCSSFLAGSGGPASRARSGAPHVFLWPLCLSALLGPLRAWVAPFLFLCLRSFFSLLLFDFGFFLRCFLCAPSLSLAFSGFWPQVPWDLALCFSSPPPPVLWFFFVFFGFFSFVVRPRCLWVSLVSGPGWPGLWRCVLFVLLVFRFSALCALSLLLCFLPGRWLLPGCCCPPPLFFVSRFWSLPLGALFFFPALLLPAGSALVSGSHRLPPPPSSCLFCWSRVARLSVCSCCFYVSRPAVGCSLVAALPPPLSPSVSRGFRRCRWLVRFFSAVSRCSSAASLPLLLFILLVSRCSALRVPSLCFCVSCLAVGCSLVVASPFPPSVSRGFRPCGSVLRFFFLSAALLLPACLALLSGSRLLLPPPPDACVVPCAV